MGAVSLLLSPLNLPRPGAAPVAVLTVALSLLALLVAVAVTSSGIQPDAELVAPFRWLSIVAADA